MNGRIVGATIIVFAAIAGAALYYLQEYYFYEDVSDGVESIDLSVAGSGETKSIEAYDIQAINAISSPIRFRACFLTDQPRAVLAETYRTEPAAEPLNAPRWFDCFDSQEIGEALETGGATAFVSKENIVYGIDRIVAIMEDGRGFAWNQINHCGEVVFDGDPAPEGCPPPPDRD
ncbi:DUF6446 family protein [Qingshengfaniella alkalisoli]|uniref:Histidine kinase n=1 Tax=Qingshengfaniella alkalisoli TaxID=2599296 RepID=A0A5B8IU23_9RHOB|nr:DUF6446 family protein [Qingshengfaniella alkalisoli]QDY69124.1 histidine kinase [Qingshengfaniella alkalisoli]